MSGSLDSLFSPLGEARDTLLAVQQAPFPVLEEKAGERMRAEILRAREAGDSVGGVVECIAQGVPVGLGSPMFQGLESQLAAALFAIPAVKGVEFGSGFKIAMRDLEIRGAGNLLGPEQSGYLMSVGYDLYLKLLEEAVLEERGEEKKITAKKRKN